MSIFKHQDLDNVLLRYLNIKDIVILSHVSRYYRKITESRLAHLREFFRIRHTLLPKILTYKKITLILHSRAMYFKNFNISHQALIYGNIDVLNYINFNFVGNLLFRIEFKDNNEYVIGITYISIEELCTLLDINDDNSIRMEYVSNILNLPEVFKGVTITHTYSIPDIERYCKNNSRKIISYIKN